jgi:SAM-dependent methyltransferase
VSDDLEALRGELLDGWQRQSRGWARQADRIREVGMPVSLRMIELAELQPGERVLELAAGPGDTGFLAARLLGPSGTLISSDAAEGMLEIARERALEQGVENVEFKQFQLEWIDLPTASVDAILCRWGVMLVVDPAAALSECRRVLRPGGRAVLAVWDVPQANPWSVIPSRAMVELELVDPPMPGRPGMFVLAEPGVFESTLREAGFIEVTVEPVAIARHYDSILDLIGETLDVSMLFNRAWAGFDDEHRRLLREEIEARSAPFADPAGGYTYPGVSLVALATA